MSRPLNTSTLQGAARDYARQWFSPTTYSKNSPSIPILGQGWVLESLYNATFKDEFDYLVNAFKRQLGPDALEEFERMAAERFTPRDETLFEQLLEEKLAIRPNGERVPGKLGTTQIGARVVGKRVKKVISPRTGREYEVLKNIYEPVYAGDEEFMASMGATVTNISAECAILGLDAIVDNLDEGTGAAVIQGRSGAQPADPDAAVTGTLLFTLTCSATAFGAAADQADGTVDAVAAAITDDTSADATATLGYCRASSTNDGATPLDDHIDGEAGTSGADFNFNTVSIVAGATVSLTAWTVTMPQGSTAT